MEAPMRNHIGNQRVQTLGSVVLERNQDRYTQGMQWSFMLDFSGEVTAT
jgi:hypothetical protein